MYNIEQPILQTAVVERRRCRVGPLLLIIIIIICTFVCLFCLFFFSKRGERGREHNSRVPGVAVETSAAESFSSPLPAAVHSRTSGVKQYVIINVYIYIYYFMCGAVRGWLHYYYCRFGSNVYNRKKKKESVIKLAAAIASTLISRLDLIASRRTSAPIPIRDKNRSAIAVRWDPGIYYER